MNPEIERHTEMGKGKGSVKSGKGKNRNLCRVLFEYRQLTGTISTQRSVLGGTEHRSISHPILKMNLDQ